MRHHSHPFKYPGDWVEQAVCADEDPRMFYPPDDKPVPRDFYAKAKAVCKRCDVVDKCLAFGENEAYGVWGMTTPVERGRMRDRKAARMQTVDEIPLRQKASGE
jgi:WhiB family redox-sensing transcriptional regulator